MAECRAVAAMYEHACEFIPKPIPLRGFAACPAVTLPLLIPDPLHFGLQFVEPNLSIPRLALDVGRFIKEGFEDWIFDGGDILRTVRRGT